jgi:hypothetical protein
MADGFIGDKENTLPVFFTDQKISLNLMSIETGILTLGVSVSVGYEDLLDHNVKIGKWFVWHPTRKCFVAGIQIWDN